jgi:hypothetical protein
MRCSGEDGKEDKKAERVDGNFFKNSPHVLSNLFLLFWSHIVKQFGILFISIGASLGFSSEAASKVAKSLN